MVDTDSKGFIYLRWTFVLPKMSHLNHSICILDPSRWILDSKTLFGFQAAGFRILLLTKSQISETETTALEIQDVAI